MSNTICERRLNRLAVIKERLSRKVVCGGPKFRPYVDWAILYMKQGMVERLFISKDEGNVSR